MRDDMSMARAQLAALRLAPPRLVSRFVLIGLLVTSIHFSVVGGLTLAGLNIEIPPAFAYIVAVAAHFTLNRNWVFASHEGYALNLSGQGVRYLAAAGLSYAVTAVAVAT